MSRACIYIHICISQLQAVMEYSYQCGTNYSKNESIECLSTVSINGSLHEPCHQYEVNLWSIHMYLGVSS